MKKEGRKKEEGGVESQIYGQDTSSVTFFFLFSPGKKWTCQLGNSSCVSRKFSPMRLRMSRNSSQSPQKVRMRLGVGTLQNGEGPGDLAENTHQEQAGFSMAHLCATAAFQRGPSRLSPAQFFYSSSQMCFLPPTYPSHTPLP